MIIILFDGDGFIASFLEILLLYFSIFSANFFFKFIMFQFFKFKQNLDEHE